MNGQSKKGNKIWQIIAKFLLLLAILISFFMLGLILIQIVGTWYPDLLKFSAVFKDKPIITIITLLANVSLLSFLLQMYMNKDPEKVGKIWKIIAYPVHWFLRFAARLMLLIAIMAAFLILAIETIVIFLIKIASLVTSTDIPLHLKNTWKHWPDQKISTVLWDKWLPGIDIQESLRGTWQCYVVKLWEFRKNIFTLPRMLLVLSILTLSIFFLPEIEICQEWRKFQEWQANVTIQLNNIKADTDVIRTDTANLMLLRSSGHPPAYLSSTGKDTISFFLPAYLSKNKDEISFLLTYPYQGNLESKKGICPADSSLNLAWLKFFKKAFSACAEDSLKLKIQGFASAAPVAERDSSKYQKAKSDSFNCEIANQRAEALIYFLMLPDSIRYTEERCKAYLDSSRIWGRVENKLCIREMPDTVAYKDMGFDVTYESQPSHIPTRSDSLVMKLKRLGFEVTYEPWRSCGEMAKAKPVQDSRRLDLEFLNRSVKITIEGDSCLTKAVSIPDTNVHAVTNDSPIKTSSGSK